jgi:Helix-turn-helix domain
MSSVMDVQELELLAEMVANLVVERLGRTVALGPMLDVNEVARYLGVTPAYVYEHAEQLGGVKLPGGKRGRLRFTLAALDAAMSSGSGSGGSEPEKARKRSDSGSRFRKRTGARAQMATVQLLPVRGQDPRDVA